MTDLSGQTIKGYVLRQRIGDPSGFGVVYLAEQPLLKREVAIKVILPQYANDPDFIRRFDVEAELVARLEHAHIVPLYDYWREPDGAFLVMRLLSGGSLSVLLQQGPLEVDQAATMLEQIAAALAFAHRRGVIHRDIKPANVLLDAESNTYLADFGIAKDLHTSTSDSGTQGAMTPAYAAPEQYKGEALSAQTDIYSLGVMLYEMLTGSHPFPGASISELVNKTLFERLPSLNILRPDLLDTLDDVIERATEKEPADRYSDAGEMATAFRAAVAGHRVPAPVVGRTTITLFVDENPYKGLRAFQESDQNDFFGREGLTERLLERLSESDSIGRFLAVVGPSGSGKSSAVKAGLIPAIRAGQLPGSEKWFLVEMFPGAHPLEELEAALLRIAVNPPDSLLGQLGEDERGLIRAMKRVLPADEQTELLLVIDQFEELFTLVEDEGVRVHFLDSLMAALKEPRGRLRLVVTLRADFYDRPLLYEAFGELIRKRTEVVLPMNARELQEAVVRPAARVGAVFETGLVEAIIQAVSEQPGTLPLLQYALYELFRHHVNGLLTRAAYETSDGVLGALAGRADALYSSFDPAQQEVTRQVFLRLVSLGEGTEDTRRRVRLSEMPANSVAVLERYTQGRLLTFDRDPVSREPTLEVAHEALIRTWRRLRTWIDDSRDDLRVQRRLAQETEEWKTAGRDPGLLAAETRLAQFENWSHTTTVTLTADESAFLDESLAQRAERERLDEARKAHEAELERRSVNRLRLLATVLVTIGVALIALMGIIFITTQTVLLGSYTELEAQNIQQDVQRALNTLSDQLNTLSASVLDYAAWDDTYQFIDDQNKDYVTANLDEVFFINLGVTVEAFIDLDGETVFIKAVDLQTGKERPVPDGLAPYISAGSPFLKHDDETGSVTGIVLVDEAPMLLSSRAILTSQITGPSRGSLIFGQFLDTAKVDKLSQELRLPVSIERLDDPNLPDDFQVARDSVKTDAPAFVKALDDNNVAGYGVIQDINGNHALLLRVAIPRDIYAQGQSSIQIFLGLLIVVGLVFVAMIVLMYQRLVHAPSHSTRH